MSEHRPGIVRSALALYLDWRFWAICGLAAATVAGGMALAPDASGFLAGLIAGIVFYTASDWFTSRYGTPADP